jgi:hypothetical protein
MSDESSASKTPRTRKSTEDGAPASDAVVEATDSAKHAARTAVAETPAAAAGSAVAGATAETEAAPPAERVIYVTAPAAPAKKGNRGIGSLYAVASGIVYAALLAVATAVVGVASGAPFSFAFLGQAQFYIPVLFFVIGFVLLVLVLNRAAWWTYIVGSLLLAVFVYFGTIGLGLLGTGIIANTPAEAAQRYADALVNPFIIVSAFLAREVSMWVGAAIAARGRRVKGKNAEAHAKYQQDLAEKKAEHERALATA